MIEIGTPCKVGKYPATIIGYIEWGGKLKYVWVKFSENEELLKVDKVKL